MLAPGQLHHLAGPLAPLVEGPAPAALHRGLHHPDPGHRHVGGVDRGGAFGFDQGEGAGAGGFGLPDVGVGEAAGEGAGQAGAVRGEDQEGGGQQDQHGVRLQVPESWRKADSGDIR